MLLLGKLIGYFLGFSHQLFNLVTSPSQPSVAQARPAVLGQKAMAAAGAADNITC